MFGGGTTGTLSARLSVLDEHPRELTGPSAKLLVPLNLVTMSAVSVAVSSSSCSPLSLAPINNMTSDGGVIQSVPHPPLTSFPVDGSQSPNATDNSVQTTMDHKSHVDGENGAPSKDNATNDNKNGNYCGA